MNALYRAFQKLIKEELRKEAGTLETSVSMWLHRWDGLMIRMVSARKTVYITHFFRWHPLNRRAV